jgi:hypothetical protein
MTSEHLTDTERLRLIVRAFLDCHQIPEVKLIMRQFRYETGRTVTDVDAIEREIERAARF